MKDNPTKMQIKALIIITNFDSNRNIFSLRADNTRGIKFRFQLTAFLTSIKCCKVLALHQTWLCSISGVARNWM